MATTYAVHRRRPNSLLNAADRASNAAARRKLFAGAMHIVKAVVIMAFMYFAFFALWAIGAGGAL